MEHVTLFHVVVLVVICLYCQIIVSRDKKRWKEWKRIEARLIKEEKRKAKEKQLAKRVEHHPKVVYISDFSQRKKLS